MTDPLDERLRALLASDADAPRPPLDAHQRLIVRARRRRRRRAVVTTALGVALLGSGAFIAPGLLPDRSPDSVTFADDGTTPAPSASPDVQVPTPTQAATPPPAGTEPTLPPGPATGASADVPPPDRLVASTVGGTHAVVLFDVTRGDRVRELAPASDDLVLTGLSPDGAYAYTQSLQVEGCGRYNALLPTDGTGRGGPVWHDDPGWPALVGLGDHELVALERPPSRGAGDGQDAVCEGDGPWDLVVLDQVTLQKKRYANASLDGFVGIQLAASPDDRHVAFLRYGADRGVSGVLTVLDTRGPVAPGEGPEQQLTEALQVDSACATRSPVWVDETRLAYLEVCPDGTSRLAVQRVVGTQGRPQVVERRELPSRDPVTYGPQDLDLDASGRHAVWSDDNRLYALDLGAADTEVRDLGIEGVSPHW